MAIALVFSNKASNILFECAGIEVHWYNKRASKNMSVLLSIQLNRKIVGQQLVYLFILYLNETMVFF